MDKKFKYSEISIHAAREGGDHPQFDQLLRHWIFQSTPPVKAATLCRLQIIVTITFQSTPPVKAATTLMRAPQVTEWISIHAAREGGDPASVHSG